MTIGGEQGWSSGKRQRSPSSRPTPTPELIRFARSIYAEPRSPITYYRQFKADKMIHHHSERENQMQYQRQYGNYIEARQWFDTKTAQDVLTWCGTAADPVYDRLGRIVELEVRSSTSVEASEPGDYILKLSDGFHVMTRDEFWSEFEPALAETARVAPPVRTGNGWPSGSIVTLLADLDAWTPEWVEQCRHEPICPDERTCLDLDIEDAGHDAAEAAYDARYES